MGGIQIRLYMNNPNYAKKVGGGHFSCNTASRRAASALGLYLRIQLRQHESE